MIGSVYQTLSEKFIEKYENKVDWNYILECQNLSELFIEKYKDIIIWIYTEYNNQKYVNECVNNYINIYSQYKCNHATLWKKSEIIDFVQ